MKITTAKVFLVGALIVAPIVGFSTQSGADPSLMTTCSISPNTGTLSPGDSFDLTITADGEGIWGEIVANGTTLFSGVTGVAPGPVSITFDQFSSYLNGQAGTVSWKLFTTDGTTQTSQTPSCSLTLSVAAAPSSTTTTAPSTTTTTTAPSTTTTTVPLTSTSAPATTTTLTALPHTGSNSSGYLIAGSAAVVLGGLFLASAARRRRA